MLENQYGDQKFNGYDYRADLGINLSYSTNFLIFAGQGLLFYTASFIFLKFHTTKIAAWYVLQIWKIK